MAGISYITYTCLTLVKFRVKTGLLMGNLTRIESGKRRRHVEGGIIDSPKSNNCFMAGITRFAAISLD